ncbi:MAG: hypothetical protein HY901_17520 [Deltaproteobacteria bacterium]|nr:hypothetical protein [Deltaproteobacteria bacterium]
MLDLLFHQGLSLTVSEMARRSGLTPRSVAVEVRNLLGLGLVSVEAVRGADQVKPNLTHPAALHIQALLRIPANPVTEKAGQQELRETLAALGAPLAGEHPQEHMNLEDALVAGLQAARCDGTLLRVLPVVLAKNLDHLDWQALKQGARRRKLKAELGLLVELTADLLDRPELCRQVADLHDRRRRVPRFYPVARSDYERRLAKERSPAVARRWGFLMNMSVESFRSSLERHSGP